MATHDDRELRNRLVSLKALLDRSAETGPSLDEAVAAMESIAGMVATAKNDFLSGPSRFALLE
jgi:hypothetical protein